MDEFLEFFDGKNPRDTEAVAAVVERQKASNSSTWYFLKFFNSKLLKRGVIFQNPNSEIVFIFLGFVLILLF